MCRAVKREIDNLIRLFLTVMVGVMFASVAGPDTLVLSGTAVPLLNLTNADLTSLGVSVLVAGSGTNKNIHNVVYWSDINSDNACQVGTPIYNQWSEPNGLCHGCSERPDGGCFQIPSDVQFKIVIVFVTIAISILLAVIQLFDFIMCGCVYMCWPLEVMLQLLLMTSAVLTFPFWTTTGMSHDLTNGGGSVVPLYVSGDSHELMPSLHVNLDTTHGYYLMCAGLAFSIVGVLALCLPKSAESRRRRAATAVKNNKSRGCCAALCCCCRGGGGGADKPAAAAAGAPPTGQPVQQVEEKAVQTV